MLLTPSPCHKLSHLLGPPPPSSVTRGATKGGWRVLKHPPAQKGVPCNSARSDDFFLVGGGLVLTCIIMNTSVISVQPYQTHPYQTTSAPVFLYSHRGL